MSRKLLSLLCVLSLAMLPISVAESDDELYTFGYGEAAIPADLTQTHYVAGYNNDYKATGILDDQYAKACILKDKNGNAIVLVSVDCVALSRGDVKHIRKLLNDFSQETGITRIHVMSTHDHAGSDTLGLWGPIGCDGKNKDFMESLYGACVSAVKDAHADLREGRLYFGSVRTEHILEDTRLPKVMDENLYSFRFEPLDGSPQTRLLNFASHAESLDGSNTMISADFPGVVAQKLKEEDGSRTLWFPGAIGGLIRTRFINVVRQTNCRETGGIIADYVLKIDNEVQLTSSIFTHTEEFSVPCDNPLFVTMKMLGVLGEECTTRGTQVTIDTEMTYLKIGEKQILLIPGELFPELAYGDDSNLKVAAPEKKLPTLCSLFGDDLLIFGLANDEIGYIVAPENFVLSEKKPYMDTTIDINGENHYEETNSAGPLTAQRIYETAALIRSKLK